MNNASKDLVSSVLKFSQEFYDRFFSDVIDIQRNELDESAIHPSEFQKMKSFESFQLVTDAIKELIELKRNFKLFQTFKNTSNDKIYQKALQKLESITRDHIKVQHQLRIYLEELQCDFDASIFNTDKAELQFLKEVDDLQAEKTSLEVLIDQKDKKIKSLKSQGSRKIEVSETERKTHSFDVAGGATWRMIDIDNKRMESEIKEKDKECRELETRFEGLKLRFRKERKRSEVTNSQFYKLKFEEKCSEVFNLHRDLTDAEIKNRQDKSRSQSPIEFLRTEPAERPRQSKSPLLRNNSNGNITKKLVRVRSARRSASSMYKPINT